MKWEKYGVPLSVKGISIVQKVIAFIVFENVLYVWRVFAGGEVHGKT